MEVWFIFGARLLISSLVNVVSQMSQDIHLNKKELC